MESHNTNRKHSDSQCIICTDHIEYYAVGECGHNEICWKCTLKQRIKLQKKECPYCKTVNYKVLITRDKNGKLDSSKDAIYDNDYDIYYEDLNVRNDILRLLGFYCNYCTNAEFKRKFPTIKSLCNHYEHVHAKYICEKCIEFKPVFIFEQKIFTLDQLKGHERKHHPHCFFCAYKTFYDQEHLNKHYVQDHQFCDLCKKLGRKRSTPAKGKYTNLPEYEVYRDWLELRTHYTRDHYVCDKSTELCLNLVFETGPQLAAHYLHAHGERRQVQVEFGFSDDEEDNKEEQKKEENANLTKDNYRETFPTLSQVNRQEKSNINANQWPSLMSQLSYKPEPYVVTKEKQIKQLKQKEKVTAQSKAKAQQVYNRVKRQQYIEEKKIENRVEHEDQSFQYNEESDQVKFSKVEETKGQGGQAGKKKKKIIVTSSSTYDQEEEDYNQAIQNSLQQNDYPSLSGKPGQQKINNNNTWNQISEQKIKANKTQFKPTYDQSNDNNHTLSKQAFPGLPKEQVKKNTKINNDDHGGGGPEQDNGITIKKKKNRKKGKGEQVSDWSKLDKKIDYNQLF